MVDPRTDPKFQKLAEMRRKAVLYYKENQVPQLMESALNKMFFEQPDDVYAYLVEFFQNHAKTSTIDKVEADEYFDSKGQPTVQAEIYSLSNGRYKKMGSAFVSSFNQLSDATTTERKEQDDEERLKGVRAAIQYINGPISEALNGISISEQVEVDEILKELANLEIAKEMAIINAVITGTLGKDGLPNKAARGVGGIAVGVALSNAAVFFSQGVNLPHTGAGGVPMQRQALAKKESTVVRATLADLQVQEAEAESARLQAAQEAAALAGGESSQPGADTPAKPPPKDEKPPKGGKKSLTGKDAPKTPEICEAPKELIFSGAQAICAVSSANCLAAAAIRSLQPFQYVSELTHSNIPEEFKMPIPMITLLSGGRSAVGKQNLIREVLLLPKPSLSLSKIIAKTKEIAYKLIVDLSRKLGLTSKMISDHGSPSPLMDKPEQLLDAVLECASLVGDLNLGEDFFLVLHCASHEYYDANKEKYEYVTSAFKSGDEMVDTVYLDLLSRYPCVIGLIDPLVQQDREAWMKLYSAVGDKCFMLGERSLGRIDQLKAALDCHSPLPLPAHGTVFQFNHSTTVSDVVHTTSKLKVKDAARRLQAPVVELLLSHCARCRCSRRKRVPEQEIKVVLSASPGDTSDTLIVDLAVGVGADFVKLGGFCRGERASKYNRLIEIEKHLANSSTLAANHSDTYVITSVGLSGEGEPEVEGALGEGGPEGVGVGVTGEGVSRSGMGDSSTNAAAVESVVTENNITI